MCRQIAYVPHYTIGKWCCIPSRFQSIADFFYLGWHLLRSLFMSQEGLWCKRWDGSAYCDNGQMTTDSADLFKGRHFDREIIVLCVFGGT